MVMEIIESIEAKILDNLLASIYQQREQIIAAFIAQYGCKPDEIEQVVQYTGDKIKWFIRKKSVT